MEALLERRGYGEASRSRYSYFYCDGSKPKPSLRGVSHELFFALSPLFAGRLLMLCMSRRALAGAGAYMVGWVAQYGVSSQFHRRRWSLAAEQFMSDLDHMTILLMCAGTYCPLLLLLPEGTRALVLTALTGFLAVSTRRTFVKRGGRAGETAMVVGMVLCVTPATPELYALSTPLEWRLHWAAIVQYLIGGLAYANHWPEPLPGVFGSQEVMHLCTCTASITTFFMNASIVSRL
jgi:channel protein (hemolysin III family)